MELVLIAAVAANGVIGADGEMPWHLPADLRHFKETTTGHPVVVGRRTYESIVAYGGGPLSGRTTVVLTRRGIDVDAANEGTDESTRVVAAGSVEEAVERAEETGADVAYVAGGADVYAQFLPLADRMVLTELEAAHEGDTRFPEWDDAEWRDVERDERDGFAFVTYERR